MGKILIPLIIILLILFSFQLKSQVLVQTYIDPCDNKTYVVNFPLTNSAINVIVRNKIKTFTYQQAQNGEIAIWVNSIFQTPCPLLATVTETQTQVATSIARTAANAASTAASTPPPSSNNTSSSSTGGNSESSTSNESSDNSSESSTESNSSESSEENKSESKSEEKKDEKKNTKTPISNPLLVASDFTTVQNADNTFSAIMNVGMSKNSLAGDISYGATAMIWSNLNQFAISTRYTKITYNDKQAVTVCNISLTTAYAMGNIFTFFGYSEVLSKPKLGVLGYNINTGAMFLLGGSKSYLTSMTIFYMKPLVINKKLTLTPSFFTSSTPLLYSDNQFIADTNLGIMVGSTFDYNITKRFKFGFDYKINFGTTPGTPILNMLMIGSKIQL
jgi:hypothetical protein